MLPSKYDKKSTFVPTVSHTNHINISANTKENYNAEIYL